jgi:Family of unknown function (DUF5947)
VTSQPGPAGLAALRRFVRSPSVQSPSVQSPSVQSPSVESPSVESPSVQSGASHPEAPPQQNVQITRDAERCELCATEIPAGHGHLADLEAASLLCACRACYLLFTQRNVGRGKYQAVPDRYLRDPDRAMTQAQWDQLEVPVGLAFFLRTSRDSGALTGFYPSPAGVTECQLDLELWQQLASSYPLLSAADDDVEAILISRSDDGVEYFLVPVDVCYELAGRMRLNWHGFDGGAEARKSIADFLAGVRDRARPYRPVGQDG